METKRYSLVVVFNLLLSGSGRKDTKTSLCLSQPGGRNSRGLTPSSQVVQVFSVVVDNICMTIFCKTGLWAGQSLVLFEESCQSIFDCD